MKKKICITPVNLYQGEQVMDWLEMQQRKGLFPCEVGSLVSVFQCCIRETQSFLLLPKTRDGMEQPPFDLTQEGQWKYMCPIGHTYCLCSAPRRTAKPHQDIDGQKPRWQREAKAYVWTVALVPLALLLAAVVMGTFAWTWWLLALTFVYLGAVSIGILQYRDSHGFTVQNPRRMRVRNGCILVWSALVMVLGLIYLGSMSRF